MIPTLPLAARNRLAGTILAAIHDAAARRTLAALAAGTIAAEEWLGADAVRHADVCRSRARSAHLALSTLPLLPRDPPLEAALPVAAALFDAGLGFEVHEVLEPYWARAAGSDREALQGLIQVAVGYQHAANGNGAGARALIEEGVRRLGHGRLAGIDLAAFADASRASLAALFGGPVPAPPFPRAQAAG